MKIATFNPGFPALGRIFSEMTKLGVSENKLPGVPLQENGGVVIVGAWYPTAKSLVQDLKSRGYRVWCYWTSPLLQAELSVLEVGYLSEIRQLLNDGILEHVITGARDMVPIFGDKCTYLEYPVTVREIPPVEVQKGNYGLLGPVHYRKNILNQMLAVKKFNSNAILHTGRLSPEYRGFAISIGLNFFEHDWLPEEDFYRLVASLDIGLQVSIPSVESFAYMVFDYLQMDRPVLSSVKWYSEGWCSFRADDIKAALERMRIHDRSYYRKFATDFAEENNRQFKEVLNSLL